MVFLGEGEEDEEVCCLIMNGCKYFKVAFFEDLEKRGDTWQACCTLERCLNSIQIFRVNRAAFAFVFWFGRLLQ